MTTSNNIIIYKGIPDGAVDPIAYIPIDGALVRTGDTVYLKLNNLTTNEVVIEIRKNGVTYIPQESLHTVGRMYELYIDDCSAQYTVVTTFASPIIVGVLTNFNVMENPIFIS